MYYLLMLGVSQKEIFDAGGYGMHDLLCNPKSYAIQDLERIKMNNVERVKRVKAVMCKSDNKPKGAICQKILDKYMESNTCCMPSYVYHLMGIMCEPEIFQAHVSRLSKNLKVDSLQELMGTEPPYAISAELMKAEVCKRLDGIEAERQACRASVILDYCLNPMLLQGLFMEENHCNVHLEWVLTSFNVVINAKNLYDLLLRDEHIERFIIAYTYCDDPPAKQQVEGEIVYQTRKPDVFFDSTLNSVPVPKKDKVEEDVCVAYYSYNSRVV